MKVGVAPVCLITNSPKFGVDVVQNKGELAKNILCGFVVNLDIFLLWVVTWMTCPVKSIS